MKDHIKKITGTAARARRAAVKAAIFAGIMLAVIAAVILGGAETALAATEFEWVEVSSSNKIESDFSNIDQVSEDELKAWILEKKEFDGHPINSCAFYYKRENERHYFLQIYEGTICALSLKNPELVNPKIIEESPYLFGYYILLDNSEKTKNNLTHVESVKPDCTKTGIKEHWISSDGRYYYDTACKYPADKEDLITPAEHLWDKGVIEQEATYKSEGSVRYTCRRSGCGETKTEIIPKTPEDTNYYILLSTLSWEKGDGELVYQISNSKDKEKAVTKMTSLTVDSSALDATAFSIDENGIIRGTFGSGFLTKLGEGKHRITADFTDGSVSAEFSVSLSSFGLLDSDNIGEETVTVTILAAAGFMLVSAFIIVAYLFIHREKKEKVPAVSSVSRAERPRKKQDQEKITKPQRKKTEKERVVPNIDVRRYMERAGKAVGTGFRKAGAISAVVLDKTGKAAAKGAAAAEKAGKAMLTGGIAFGKAASSHIRAAGDAASKSIENMKKTAAVKRENKAVKPVPNVPGAPKQQKREKPSDIVPPAPAETNYMPVPVTAPAESGTFAEPEQLAETEPFSEPEQEIAEEPMLNEKMSGEDGAPVSLDERISEILDKSAMFKEGNIDDYISAAFDIETLEEIEKLDDDDFFSLLNDTKADR